MRWIRRNKVKASAAAAIAVGVLAMLLAVTNLLSSGPEAATQAGTPTSQPSIDVPAYTGTADVGDADQSTSPALTGIPSFPGAGAADLEGLDGQGGIVGLPKERIVLTMTSAAPIAYVGYVVPTSLDNQTGTVMDPGTSWSLSTIGYGPPDHAQLFSLAGPTGVPVTCTITVNGTVTETRTTSGPYDQLFCQG